MNYDQGIRSLLPSVKLEDELKAEAAAKKFVLDRLGVSTTAKPSVQAPLIMDPLVSSIDIDKILRPKEDEAPDAIEMDKGLDKYRAEPRYKPKKVSERVKYREMMKHLTREARNPTPRVDFKLAETGRELSKEYADGRLVRPKNIKDKFPKVMFDKSTNKFTAKPDKTIKVMVNRYSSNYPGVLHETNHWDAGGSSDMFNAPTLSIKAIGSV